MTKEEFINWRDSRITQDIFRYIEINRNGHYDEAAFACLRHDEVGAVAIANAVNAGIVLGLNQLLKIEWEDLGITSEEE